MVLEESIAVHTLEDPSDLVYSYHQINRSQQNSSSPNDITSFFFESDTSYVAAMSDVRDNASSDIEPCPVPPTFTPEALCASKLKP